MATLLVERNKGLLVVDGNVLELKKNDCFVMDRKVTTSRLNTYDETTIFKVDRISENVITAIPWRDEKYDSRGARWDERKAREINVTEEELKYIRTIRLVDCPAPSSSSSSASSSKKEEADSLFIPKCDEYRYDDDIEVRFQDVTSNYFTKNAVFEDEGATEPLQFFDFNFDFPATGNSLGMVKGLTAVRTGHGGMNDCLVHAVLNCCDPTFRYRKQNQKDRIASFMRRKVFAEIPGLSKVQKDLFKSQDFLTDESLVAISNCLKICFGIFCVGRPSTPQYEKTFDLIGTGVYFGENRQVPQKCFLIQNDGTYKRYGTHYSALCFKPANVMDKDVLFSIPIQRAVKLTEDYNGTGFINDENRFGWYTSLENEAKRKNEGEGGERRKLVFRNPLQQLQLQEAANSNSAPPQNILSRRSLNPAMYSAQSRRRRSLSRRKSPKIIQRWSKRRHLASLLRLRKTKKKINSKSILRWSKKRYLQSLRRRSR
jgi:hypothetical protein